MTRQLCTAVTLALVSVAIPLRATERPHAGMDSRTVKVWTNDDLEKLHAVGGISIVGRINNEDATSASSTEPYAETQDPKWYAEQAENLQEELERRRTRLLEYQRALDEARSGAGTTGGIDLAEGDTGVTPEDGIEILERRVNETEARLDALEDLARENGIALGTLRGQ
jgi:hypothetical protein